MTAFLIKLVALSAMLVDHTAAVLPEYFPFWFRIIGRLAFPLFAYLLAEACRHTRSMPKLMLRLLAFALISQIPFDLAVNGGHIHFLYDTNTLYTLLLGAAAVYAYQYFYEKQPEQALLWSFMPLTALMVLADWLHTDYGARGVIFIFTMYVIPGKKLRLAAMALLCCWLYSNTVLGILGKWLGPLSAYAIYAPPRRVIAALFCLLSVPLAALYNGKRGPEHKWLFYIFYPAHLLALAIIKTLA